METVNRVQQFGLPTAPADQSGPVKAWSEPVVIPTYLPMPPDKNPMFLENRVYQGSSGRVYPLPFTDRISTQKCDHAWQAVHLENQYLRIMILPEIGGRIHVGLDKTNGYDFFYRQNVIKPALVGLAGPWISGGVEFNWPQHHRPATFMPVNFEIEEHADGSRTVWCSDHEPMNRMKGMHGICLHPESACIELKVRLYNRTPFIQTFLWWANVAVRVHERYQSFFPADVSYVADHAKRAMSRFPLCTGTYYGINYGRRAGAGIPPNEIPAHYAPPGSYPPNDLSWYANIPVPTSYMAMGSQDDFFGGYDHAREAGVVHFANHHISPGKKQWTWGNHEFGYAWDRNLTEEDGPYIELMAGVYTDNQPDFSFLVPGETKVFSQFWYPIQKIGAAHKANRDAAVSLRLDGGAVRIGVSTSCVLRNARIVLQHRGCTVAEWSRDLAPGQALVDYHTTQPESSESEFTLIIQTAEGGEVIRHTPGTVVETELPLPASEPLPPTQLRTNEELYLTGVHLEQYRHATRRAEDYWREALRRNPSDARCNQALGIWHLRRGEFPKAESHLREAIGTLTKCNPNPPDGEPYYHLGLTLRYLDRDHEAYHAFFKATWNYAWRSAAYHALAELDSKRGDWEMALEHAFIALRTNADDSCVRNLAVILLRKLNRLGEAERLLHETLDLDRLDYWARYLAGLEPGWDNQSRLDVAFDYARAGFYQDAAAILRYGNLDAGDSSLPSVLYSLAHFEEQTGEHASARQSRIKAQTCSSDYCFPSRLEELLIVQAACEREPNDARAHYLLGNLLYDRRRHAEAIACWERSANLDSNFSVVWRNLGIGYFNVLHDAQKARHAFERALEVNPNDARLLYEQNQLAKRMRIRPAQRLRTLNRYPELLGTRDDLSVELANLYNQTGRHDAAQQLLSSRRFQPWEGGEGLVLEQHVRTQLALGRQELTRGNPQYARRLFEAALDSPKNLGEARHLLTNQSSVHYWLGVACHAVEDHLSARQFWIRAAESSADFREMNAKSLSEQSYYSVLALKALNRTDEAQQLCEALLTHARGLRKANSQIDYFATSLPAMLLFHDDLRARNAIAAKFIEAQAAIGLGQTDRGRRLLSQVLRSDPAHAPAADLLSELETESVFRNQQTAHA
jgi:tetratricopeptide (TPR) repeat protein